MSCCLPVGPFIRQLYFKILTLLTDPKIIFQNPPPHRSSLSLLLFSEASPFDWEYQNDICRSTIHSCSQPCVPALLVSPCLRHSWPSLPFLQTFLYPVIA